MKQKMPNGRTRKKRIYRYIIIGGISLILGFLFHGGVFVFSQINTISAHDNVKDGKDTIYKTAYSSEVRKSVERLSDKCKKVRDTGKCYVNEFTTLTENTSLEHAIQTLKAAQIDNETVRACHLIGHAISIAETRKDPTKWKEIVGVVPPDECAGGFLHGVMEAYMAYDKDFSINAETIPETCRVMNEATGFRGKHLTCSHIMGHLLMVESGGYINHAVGVCSALPAELQYECYSGVFMENETRENLIVHKIKDQLIWNESTTKEQESLCRKYRGTAGKACWREISHMFAFLSQNDPVGLNKYCSQVSDSSLIEECYLHGIGVIAVAPRVNPGSFALLCNRYDGNDLGYSTCISFVVHSMIMSSPEYAARSVSFCKALPAEYKAACFDKVIDRIYYIAGDTTKRERYCLVMPEEYQDSCIGEG